ncbi:hypothetical protein RB653_000421 [Dictyostelium firmibasis]|uniref:Rab GTPase n=1 Tax=Dictyostelium firmibasis TaxID=79012 RepID=A0AAN7TV37_9MYCE
MGCNQSKLECSTPTSTTTTTLKSQKPPCDLFLKILMIGNSSVGKSSMLVRYTKNTFSDSYTPTLGIDFCLKTIEIDDKIIKLQIWDTAGQERFNNITSSYYRGANGVMIVYDITNQESFYNLKKWLGDVEYYAGPNISKIIVGNKCDLEETRAVDFINAKKFANDLNIPIMEVSAKDSSNLEDAFLFLIPQIIKTWVPPTTLPMPMYSYLISYDIYLITTNILVSKSGELSILLLLEYSRLKQISSDYL